MTIRAMDGIPTPVLSEAGPTRAGRKNPHPVKTARSRRASAQKLPPVALIAVDGASGKTWLTPNFNGSYQSREMLHPSSPHPSLPCHNIPGQRGIGLNGGSHVR